MPRHDATMLRASWTCLPQASIGTVKSARLQLQPHASVMLRERWTCLTQASVGTMKSARLRLQPHASACGSCAARKLDLSNTSQRRHYERCQVATAKPHASACRSYAARKLDLSNTSQPRHYEKCQVATATACLGMPQLCCEKARPVQHKPA